jgi:hypothetical protein
MTLTHDRADGKEKIATTNGDVVLGSASMVFEAIDIHCVVTHVVGGFAKLLGECGQV